MKGSQSNSHEGESYVSAVLSSFVGASVSGLISPTGYETSPAVERGHGRSSDSGVIDAAEGADDDHFLYKSLERAVEISNEVSRILLMEARECDGYRQRQLDGSGPDGGGDSNSAAPSFSSQSSQS